MRWKFTLQPNHAGLAFKTVPNLDQVQLRRKIIAHHEMSGLMEEWGGNAPEIGTNLTNWTKVGQLQGKGFAKRAGENVCQI